MANVPQLLCSFKAFFTIRFNQPEVSQWDWRVCLNTSTYMSSFKPVSKIILFERIDLKTSYYSINLRQFLISVGGWRGVGLATLRTHGKGEHSSKINVLSYSWRHHPESETSTHPRVRYCLHTPSKTKWSRCTVW